ncbi:protein Atg16l2-like [Ascaphus truei]|uniref:protein Atg16l2-like n=1 Tax=Ascaphus truei TaxID=8439 RepID=UPI003F594454
MCQVQLLLPSCWLWLPKLGAARSSRTGGAGTPSSRTDWKHHISRQLKHRDRTQKCHFQDVIQSYNKLLEKTSLLKHLTEKLQTELIDSPSRQTTRLPEEDLVPPDSRGSEMQRLKQQGQIEELQAVSGELAYEAFELMKQVQVKENKLEEQQTRYERGTTEARSK